MSWRQGRQPDRRLWPAARRACLERDNWRCQCRGCERCGDGPPHYGNEADHITPIDRMPADADLCALAGLQCLCRGCHIVKSRGEVKPDTPGRAAWRALLAEMEKE